MVSKMSSIFYIHDFNFIFTYQVINLTDWASAILVQILVAYRLRFAVSKWYILPRFATCNHLIYCNFVIFYYSPEPKAVGSNPASPASKTVVSCFQSESPSA